MTCGPRTAISPGSPGATSLPSSSSSASSVSGSGSPMEPMTVCRSTGLHVTTGLVSDSP